MERLIPALPLKNTFPAKHVFRVLPLLALLACNVASAQSARLEGDRFILPAVRIGNDLISAELQMTSDNEGLEFEVLVFAPLTSTTVENPGVFADNRLLVPEILVNGLLYAVELELTGASPFRFRLLSVEVLSDIPAPPATVCSMNPDRSHGPNNPVINSGWAVPTNFVADGGPAPDGIPPLERPQMLPPGALPLISPHQLVVGVKIGNDVRAYPHNILDWHEVVNDSFSVAGADMDVTLSYCPLTGSAMLWKGALDSADPTFGTSGLLYNSNLIMYDRQTGSLWSQMLEQAVSGPRLLEIPERLQVIETSWGTWSSMYPQTRVLSESTGFSRNYALYPYGTYRTDLSVFFNVNNSEDFRIDRKERVVGINVGASSKVYPLSQFPLEVEVLHDQVGGEPVVVAGSAVAGYNFAVIYSRRLADCSVLDFEPVQNRLPIIMRDHEGTEWDIFGEAQSGPRAGERLSKTNSYIAYWFAWAAFFPEASIHE